MSMRDRVAENTIAVSGAGVAVVSPELLISLCGVLVAVGSVVWGIIRDKQNQAEQRRHNLAMEELAKNGKQVKE